MQNNRDGYASTFHGKKRPKDVLGRHIYSNHTTSKMTPDDVYCRRLLKSNIKKPKKPENFCLPDARNLKTMCVCVCVR